MKPSLLSPIGALTSKPFAFVARPWELTAVPSVDIFDAILGSIRLDIRGNELLRVLPQVNDSVSEDWATDRVRFSYDGLKRQRILYPFIREGSSWSKWAFSLAGIKTPFVKVPWAIALSALSTKLGSLPLTLLCGKDLSFTSLLSAYSFARLAARRVYLYAPELTIHGVKFCLGAHFPRGLDLLLPVGLNLRQHAPLLNLRIRRSVEENRLLVAGVALPPTLNFRSVSLSQSAVSFFRSLLAGRTTAIKLLRKLGNSQFLFSTALSSLVNLISDARLPLNIGLLPRWPSYVSVVSFGGSSASHLVNGSFSLGLSADFPLPAAVCEAFSLGVFASHGESRVANQASIICPAAAFGEATEIFYNLEGSSRKANFAVTPPSGIRTVAGIFAAWKSFLSLEGSIKLVSVSDATFAYRPTVTRLVVREHLRFGLRSLFAAVGSEFTYSSHPVLRASRPMALAAARFENLVSNFS